MNTTPIWKRNAIINWKEFHRAGLNKKRRIYGSWGHKKVGLLTSDHYMIYNLLRDLPFDRGNKNATLIDPKTMSQEFLNNLGMPFNLSGWEIKGLLQKAITP